MSMYRRLFFSRPRIAPLLTVLTLASCPALEPAPPPPRFGSIAQEVPLWCYRTLAAPECYREEQPQFASRLIGSYVELPPPPPPPWTYPSSTSATQ